MSLQTLVQILTPFFWCKMCVLDFSTVLTFVSTRVEEKSNFQMISEENSIFEINGLFMKFLKQKKKSIALLFLHQSEGMTRTWFLFRTKTNLPVLTFCSHCAAVIVSGIPDIRNQIFIEMCSKRYLFLKIFVMSRKNRCYLNK